MARILVVGERRAGRRYLSEALAAGRHEAVEAATAPQALASARQQRPALVLSELGEPEGLELVRSLREDPRLAGTPVVIHAATYRDDDAGRLARACGVDEVLAKPATAEQVLHSVERLLARGGAGRLLPAEEGRPPASPARPDHDPRLAGSLPGLLDLAIELAGQEDEAGFGRRVCEAACRLFDCSGAAWLHTDIAGVLQVVHAEGVASARAQELARRWVPSWLREGLLRAQDTEAALMLVDPGEDRSAALLLVDEPAVQPFDDEDESLARLLASAVGALAAALHARERLQRRVEELTDSLQRVR
jgi:CheY-like chemotaxis protein